MINCSTNCSICNKPLGGKYRFKESRVGIFKPVVKEGEIVCFAMGEGRLALCKSCTQSLYSWIKNRRKKFEEKLDVVNPDLSLKSDVMDAMAFANLMNGFSRYD